VQALAPAAGALMIAQTGAPATIATLALLSAVNVALMLALWRMTAESRAGPSSV